MNMRCLAIALLLSCFSVIDLIADGPAKQHIAESPGQDATMSVPWWPSCGTNAMVIDLIAENGGPIYAGGFQWFGPWEVREWSRATIGMLFDWTTYPDAAGAWCEVYWAPTDSGPWVHKTTVVNNINGEGCGATAKAATVDAVLGESVINASSPQVAHRSCQVSGAWLRVKCWSGDSLYRADWAWVLLQRGQD